jgi:hypothetical protein
MGAGVRHYHKIFQPYSATIGLRLAKKPGGEVKTVLVIAGSSIPLDPKGCGFDKEKEDALVKIAENWAKTSKFHYDEIQIEGD